MHGPSQFPLCFHFVYLFFFLVKISGIHQLCLQRQLSQLLILVLAFKQQLRDGYSVPLLSFLPFFRADPLRKCHVSIEQYPHRPTNGMIHHH